MQSHGTEQNPRKRKENENDVHVEEEVQCEVLQSKQDEEGICTGGLFMVPVIEAKEWEKEGVYLEVETGQPGMPESKQDERGITTEECHVWVSGLGQDGAGTHMRFSQEA